MAVFLVVVGLVGLTVSFVAAVYNLSRSANFNDKQRIHMMLMVPGFVSGLSAIIGFGMLLLEALNN